MTPSDKDASQLDTSTPSETAPAAMSEDQDAATRTRDLEAAISPAQNPDRESNDPNYVTWEKPQDPENPKNWTTKERMVVTIVMSTFTFISPVSSSMVAPALGKLGQDLGMHKEMEVEMALSIFVLGYALGPLFFGPMSEVFGRSRVLQFSNLFYLVWNLSCGFAQNRAEFFVFRFLAGIGGSAPLAIGAGVIR